MSPLAVEASSESQPLSQPAVSPVGERFSQAWVAAREFRRFLSWSQSAAAGSLSRLAVQPDVSRVGEQLSVRESQVPVAGTFSLWSTEGSVAW